MLIVATLVLDAIILVRSPPDSWLSACYIVAVSIFVNYYFSKLLEEPMIFTVIPIKMLSAKTSVSTIPLSAGLIFANMVYKQQNKRVPFFITLALCSFSGLNGRIYTFALFLNYFLEEKYKTAFKMIGFTALDMVLVKHKPVSLDFSIVKAACDIGKLREFHLYMGFNMFIAIAACYLFKSSRILSIYITCVCVWVNFFKEDDPLMFGSIAVTIALSAFVDHMRIPAIIYGCVSVITCLL